MASRCGQVFSDDVMNNNCRYDFTFVAACAPRWAAETLAAAKTAEESSWMRCLHILHHSPRDLHLVQAFSFQWAFCFGGVVSESKQARGLVVV